MIKPCKLLSILIFIQYAVQCAEPTNGNQVRLEIDCRKPTAICAGRQSVRVDGHVAIVIRMPSPHSKFCAIKTPRLKVFAPQAPHKYILEEKFFDPVVDIHLSGEINEQRLREEFAISTELVIDTRRLRFPGLGVDRKDLYVFSERGIYQLLLSDDLYSDREHPVYEMKLRIDFRPID